MRKIPMSMQQVRRMLGSVVACVVLFLLATCYVVPHYAQSLESEQLFRDNRRLQYNIQTLEQSLPALHALNTQTEQAFHSLWNQSKLGPIPSLNTQNDTSMHELVLVNLPPLYTSNLFDVKQTRNETQEQLRATMHKAQQLQLHLTETLDYFYEANDLLMSTPSIRPVRTSVWLTSSFGKRRDPMDGRWLMHKGIDMAGSIGTPVVAPADGIVIFAGRRGGYGQLLVLDHGLGIQTHYGHLSAFLVTPGTLVTRGTPIARIGSTGKSTGPHLHYEVRRFGQPVNPSAFILN